MTKLILDYSDFVEKTCKEEDAVYESYPSIADVARSAYRFLDSAEKPPDPFSVPYSYYKRAIELWSEFHRARLTAFGEWHYLNQCPYCTAAVNTTYATAPDPNKLLFKQVAIQKCSNCGWWAFEEELPVEQDKEDSYHARSIYRRAVLREYSIAGSEAPILSLRQHLIRHPNALYSMTPTRLEELVGAVFGEFLNCEAIHVGGPNDEGIDVVLVNGDRQYVVQVKRRLSDSVTEAVSTIREFLGAMVLGNSLQGLFVTTANRFSKQAIAAAQRAQDIGAVDYIKLVNAEKLINICKITNAHLLPPEQRFATKTEELHNHLESGFNSFMALFMGHSDWQIHLDDSTNRDNK